MGARGAGATGTGAGARAIAPPAPAPDAPIAPLARAPIAPIALFAPLLLVTCALAQSAQTTNDPFPQPINATQDVGRVNVADYAQLPMENCPPPHPRPVWET